jgi:hypothetical protein
MNARMDPASSKLLREVLRLADAVREAHLERLEKTGLTDFDRRLLERLQSARRPVSPQRLARPLLCPSVEVERRLRVLQARTWVAEVAPTGRDTVAFELCAAGRRALAQVGELERPFETALECAVTDADLRAATSLLRVARGRLQNGRQPRRRVRGRGAGDADDLDRPRRTEGASGGSAARPDVAGAARA